jgi:hypothetical protein
MGSLRLAVQHSKQSGRNDVASKLSKLTSAKSASPEKRVIMNRRHDAHPTSHDSRHEEFDHTDALDMNESLIHTDPNGLGAS